MSLIINMLKDLEKRENNREIQPYIGYSYVDKHRRLRWFNHKISYITAAVLLLTLIAAMLIYKKSHQQTNTLPPFLGEMITAPAFDSASVDEKWQKPVSVNGITLQIKDNITEMTFLLDHAALYRLVSDGTQNQITIYIDHATLQSELPAIHAINTAILNVSSQVVNDDTKFIIKLAPNSFIKYVNLNDAAKNSELVIAIESVGNSIATATTKDMTQIIKTTASQSLLVQQYKRALVAAQSSNYQSAINDLSALLKVDPNYSDARVSLAALLLDQGNAFKADETIEAGLKLNPSYSPFVELKARMLTNAGKTKLALALLQSAPPSLTENPDYHAFIAALYEQTNQNLLAATLYKQLLALNPHKGNWWFGLGVALDRSGYPKDAINAYSKAIMEGHLNSESVAYLQNRLHDLQGDTGDTA